MNRSCNACGNPASFLVSMPYNELVLAGRLLSYCANCRARSAAFLGVSIPWSLVDLDPVGTMAVLYGEGLTATGVDPSGVLQLPNGPWPEILRMAGTKDQEAPDLPEQLLKSKHVFYREKQWQRLLRLSQAIWRENRGFPIGFKGETPVGNWIELDYARESGCNFLSPEIRRRVSADLASFSDGEQVNQRRLYSNLLSSQPLCYNLFGELAQDVDLATAFFQTWWGDLARVDDIRFEYSPGRRNERFTGTRSAFDVFIEYTSATNKRGFIGIEMKYHERLDDGKSNEVRERPLEVARRSGVFLDSENPALRKLPLSQIFLDHTLALSMLQDEDSRWDEGHFLLIHPSINESCRSAADEYRTHLVPTSTSFSQLTLEDAVDALLVLADAPWAMQLKHRYLQQWPMHFAQQLAGGEPTIERQRDR